MFDIPDIEREFFVPVESVAAVYLCPSGDTRFCPLATDLCAIISVEIRHEQGAGTDETHIATQNVE